MAYYDGRTISATNCRRSPLELAEAVSAAEGLAFDIARLTGSSTHGCLNSNHWRSLLLARAAFPL
jgi:hypothetical protein